MVGCQILRQSSPTAKTFHSKTTLHKLTMDRNRRVSTMGSRAKRVQTPTRRHKDNTMPQLITVCVCVALMWAGITMIATENLAFAAIAFIFTLPLALFVLTATSRNRG